jgi:hypothetical protein
MEIFFRKKTNLGTGYRKIMFLGMFLNDWSARDIQMLENVSLGRSS